MTKTATRNQKSERTGLSIGASSILVIFVLLCLVTFAVLSLVSARADKLLSDKNKTHVTEYYAAETAAYKELAQIDGVLQDCRAKTDQDDVYTELVCAALAESSAYTPQPQEDGTLLLRGTEVISTRQSLIVSLEVLPRSEDGKDGYYRVLEWRVQGEGDWEPSDTLPVYGAGDTGALPTL
ncbi:MAG: hypothetical protein RR075_05120 [Pygmaiobacter sp.]